MAGTAKPYAEAIEASYSFIEGSLSAGNGDILFDGNVSFATGYSSGYFYGITTYIILDINEKCDIWRISSMYVDYHGPLKVYKWNGTNFIDVGLTNYAEIMQLNVWSKFYTITEPGRYKFEGYPAINSTYRIDSEWFLEKINSSYFLISDSNEYKSYNGTNWFVVTTNTPTVSDFTTHGFENTSYVTNYINDNESCDISLLMYNENVIEIAPMNITALPKKQLVQQENEISLHDIINIDNITFASTITNNSYIKCFVSKDQGTTWYTYYNEEWVSHESTIENIETYGMNVQTLQNINTWNTFYDSIYTTLKFVFVLYKDNISDSCNINTLTIQVDLKGKWRGTPNNNTVYVFDYINPTLCKMELYKPGIYKVNY